MIAILTPLPVKFFACHALARLAATSSPPIAFSLIRSGGRTKLTDGLRESAGSAEPGMSACTSLPKEPSTCPPSAFTAARAAGVWRAWITTRTRPSFA